VLIEEFFDLVRNTPGVRRPLNDEQKAAIAASNLPATMIVAGPGSGKTTVLVLRAIRMILLDGMAPEAIVITTFTIKAAKEIRSRLVEWGTALIDAAREGPFDMDPAQEEHLRVVDINRVVTGTLDSICQEAISSDRRPDEAPFTVLDPYAAKVMLQRRALSQVWNGSSEELQAYVGPFRLMGEPARSRSQVSEVLVGMIDRFVHDDVDMQAYAAGPAAGQRIVSEVATRYRALLDENSMVDFATLERRLLDRIEEGRVPAMLEGVEAIMVDEYQDTNRLQESIYFALARQTGAGLTVVGDDDQSLYRFRGATIELFRAFLDRFENAAGERPTGPLYLTANYRSSPEIVGFYNRYIVNDPEFVPGRITPPKPLIQSQQASEQWPVMGMFRQTKEELAADLAGFLDQVFVGGGFSDVDGNLPSPLHGARERGALGDVAFLGFSVKEQKVWMADSSLAFPGHLRAALADRGLAMYNPAGRPLREIPELRRLLGMSLLAICPDAPRPFEGEYAASIFAKRCLEEWVLEAQDMLETPPPDVYGKSLVGELDRWQRFVRDGSGALRSGSDWPFLDVIYGFLPFFPFFEDDPEGQVYLEAISRAAAQTASFSGYRGRLLRDEPHRTRSRDSILRDVFVAIADDMIQVDEEIMPQVPRDRLPVMTIHQAKGLEFPLVIVDVGAEFTRNHPRNAFRRFPQDPSSVAIMEDHLAPYTPDLGPLRMQRTGLERSFEDLIRLHYVAFSRAEAALLLVGTNAMLKGKTPVRSVATWHRMDETWPWRPEQGRPPSIVTPAGIAMI